MNKRPTFYEVEPSFEEACQYLANGKKKILPVYLAIPADSLTPVLAYLKLSIQDGPSFLLESVSGGERLARYSFLGAAPYRVERINGQDPLEKLKACLNPKEYVSLPGLPSFTGGAIGYVSFECVEYFEPKTAEIPLQDPIGMPPESAFMFCDQLVIFDHLYQRVNLVAHIRLDSSTASLKETEKRTLIMNAYVDAQQKLREMTLLLEGPIPTVPTQEITTLDEPFSSNVGEGGYRSFVRELKQYIVKGDIIQAVPSQRLARKTDLSPFQIYRHLRTLNPSPYMFFLDFKSWQLIGASPEMLVKVEGDLVQTRPIAGTRKRGSSHGEDEALAQELLNDEKERAEHVMLVDLGRNDVNRVCKPATVTLSSFMQVERYSHVMHLVSNVQGRLRPECDGWDAFRSIFPAGTVSGAPKIRAIQLIRQLEGVKRGVYGGAVGHFNFNGDLDTCIALRTMWHQNGVVYLQAGGGIVHDSEEGAEYQETVNKLGANVKAINEAESYYLHRIHF